MLDYIRGIFRPINDSKFLIGISMLLINVGSKYVEMGLSSSQEEALRNGLGREILIFAMMFTGTRDIVVSILMTAAFVILSDYLLNEKSKYCIIPEQLRRLGHAADKNKDKIISPKEEADALRTLKLAETQKQRANQEAFNNFLINNKI
jgi:hypothetical protein